MDEDGLVITIRVIGDEFEVDVNDGDASVKQVIDLLNDANSHILRSFYSLIGNEIDAKNYSKKMKTVKINKLLND